MAVRSEDYGDQFPSDTGDVAPLDPTSGLTEIDYQVKGTESIPRRTQAPPEFAPSGVEAKQIHVRDSYSATILGLSSDRSVMRPVYFVSRADGALGTAQASTSIEHGQFEIGDEVTIVASPEKEHWTILGKPQLDPHPLFVASLLEDVFFKEDPVILPLLEEFSQQAPKAALGQGTDIEIPDTETIQINKAGFYQIEIEVEVHPLEGYYDSDKIYVSNGFGDLDGFGVYDAGRIGNIFDVHTHRINFAREQGFAVKKMTDDPIGGPRTGTFNTIQPFVNVEMQAPAGSVLQHPDPTSLGGLGAARWTKNLSLLGNINLQRTSAINFGGVQTNGQGGWLFNPHYTSIGLPPMYNRTGGFGTGDKDGSPFLVLKGLGQNTMQLGWQAGGFTGTFTASHQVDTTPCEGVSGWCYIPVMETVSIEFINGVAQGDEHGILQGIADFVPVVPESFDFTTSPF